MSVAELIITCHIKNQEHFDFNEKKGNKKKPALRWEVLEWSGINYKAAILKMLQQPIMNMLETK